MAQVTSHDHFPTTSNMNPIFGFPSQLESSQTDRHRNNCLNLSSSMHDPAGTGTGTGTGTNLHMTMYNNQSAAAGVRNSTAGELYSKSRKRGREEDDLQGLNAWININTKINTTGLTKPISPNYGLIENHMMNCSPSNSPSCRGGGGDDIYARILREQQELALFILMHTEKLRLELEQRRRHYWSSTLHVVEERMQRIINGKDVEIEKMSKRNSALEEKVKMLVMEGQIWKGLARRNEATAMSLRRDLDQLIIMAQARSSDQGELGDSTGPVHEDSMSCCDDINWKKKKKKNEGGNQEEEEEEEEDRRRWRCHGCRSKEICVLLLPCRHLCLCSDCDPQLQSCPLCLSPKSASIKVHMSW